MKAIRPLDEHSDFITLKTAYLARIIQINMYLDMIHGCGVPPSQLPVGSALNIKYLTPHGRRRGRYKPCEAMRRGAPFSMVSTVRDDPRRCGYLRDVLYTLRVTKKILARLRTAISISSDLGL